MYREKEVELSQIWLKDIFSLDYQACLIGGWAVYETVNRSYEEDIGRPYIGSKDIDIGFHIDPSWNMEQVMESDYLKFLKYLEKEGFTWVGYRFLKEYDYETGKALSKEETANKPAFEIVEFYIDPVVDNVHPLMSKELLINPIDEPLLELVFDKKMVNEVNLGNNIKATIPQPEVLLAMKLNTVDTRTKDHKRIKDIADIFALIWHSEPDLEEIREKVTTIKNIKEIEKTIREFKIEELEHVSRIINYETREIANILNVFIRR
jgi:hypothetical protein